MTPIPVDDYDEVRVLIGPSSLATPISGAHVMRQNLLDTIDRATRSLLIAGYMLNSDEIFERLLPKCATIAVNIHLDYAQTMGDSRAKKIFHELQNAGAIVQLHREDLEGSMHAKVIIADDFEAIVGSANLTFSGADRNVEVGLRLRGPSVRILRKAVVESMRD